MKEFWPLLYNIDLIGLVSYTSLNPALKLTLIADIRKEEVGLVGFRGLQRLQILTEFANGIELERYKRVRWTERFVTGK